jgi:hypothetical protein
MRRKHYGFSASVGPRVCLFTQIPSPGVIEAAPALT